jgi:SAM-dependent methyltransferase
MVHATTGYTGFTAEPEMRRLAGEKLKINSCLVFRQAKLLQLISKLSVVCHSRQFSTFYELLYPMIMSESKDEIDTYVKIMTDIHIPKGLKTDPRFIVPDEVVRLCAEEFGLVTLIGIDPMCGVGTIPRVIAELGGRCDAIDVDPTQVAIARHELSDSVLLMQGDSLKVQLPITYDYIYTSVPFVWFASAALPNDELGRVFRQILKPGGTLLVDSDQTTERDGQTWHLAERQKQYFSKHNFRFETDRRFRLSQKSAGDARFVELKFTAI